MTKTTPRLYPLFLLLLGAWTLTETKAFVPPSRHKMAPRWSHAKPSRRGRIPSPSPHQTTTTTTTSTCRRRSSSSSTTRLQGVASRVGFPLLSLTALGSVVWVHELGHYLAARMLGIPVVDFSIGMGPRMGGFTKWGHQFSLRALPLGGFVEFAGTQDVVVNGTDKSKLLQNRPWYERAMVLSAGVVFNLLLAYILFLGIAIRAGLLRRVSFFQLSRGTFLVVAQMARHKATGAMSLLGDVWQQMAASALDTMGAVLRALVNKLTPVTMAQPIRVLTKPAVDPLTQLSGPIQVVQAGSAIAQQTNGITHLASFMGLLSLNLGVMNALPLPILDGGRLLFVLFEGITGRKVPEKVENALGAISAWLLLFIMFSTSTKEIAGLF